LIPYLNREGQHGFLNPQPQKPFDMDQFMANLVAATSSAAERAALREVPAGPRFVPVDSRAAP